MQIEHEVLKQLSVTPKHPEIVYPGVIQLSGPLTFYLTALTRNALRERPIGVLTYPSGIKLIEDPFSTDPPTSITRRVVGAQELAQIRAGRMTLDAQISTIPDDGYISSVDAIQNVETIYPHLIGDLDVINKLISTQNLMGLLVTLRM